MSRGRVEIDSEKCKGCALCVGACPEGILGMSRDSFNKQGVPFAQCVEPEKCTACMFCGIICPDSAINVFRRTGSGE
jgi:2-oxoglutarate ferredoxin oxidoreductase subunit delta